MKVCALRFWMLAGVFATVGGGVACGQGGGQEPDMRGHATNRYSTLAMELIEAYQLPPGSGELDDPQVLALPWLQPLHVTEKYGPAWEELLLESVKSPCDVRVARMQNRIREALAISCRGRFSPAVKEALRKARGVEVDPSGGREPEMPGSATNRYSALAMELIEAYQPPPRSGELRQPHVLEPPGLRSQHLTEKYRSAWEELLLELYKLPYDRRVNVMRGRIMEALETLGDERSVPVLAEAFAKTTGEEVDQSRVVLFQYQTLRALTAIRSTNALEAIFASLDRADKRYGDGEPETTSSGWTLREAMYRAMMQTDNPGESDSQKARLEYSRRWRALLDAYQNPKLSPKNREFVEKARGRKRWRE